MRRCLKSFLFLVLAATNLAFADVRSDLSDSRRRLDGSESRLRRAGDALASAQAALMAAQNQQADASYALGQVAGQSVASQQAIAEAQASIDQALPNLRSADDLVAQKRAIFDSAKTRADAAAADVQRYHQQRIAAFEASTPFRQANGVILLAQSRLDAERARSNQWLYSSTDYFEAYTELEDSEETVRALRTTSPPADAQTLGDASQRWMNALNAMEKLKSEAAKTPIDESALLAAQANLNAATRAKAALVEQFNQQFAIEAEFRRLDAAASLAASEASSAANEVNVAMADRSAIADDVARLLDLITAEQDRLAQAARDAATLQAQLASAGSDVAVISVGVQQIQDCYTDAWRDRDFHARRYREAMAHGRDWRDGSDSRRHHEDDERDRERREREEREHRAPIGGTNTPHQSPGRPPAVAGTGGGGSIIVQPRRTPRKPTTPTKPDAAGAITILRQGPMPVAQPQASTPKESNAAALAVARQGPMPVASPSQQKASAESRRPSGSGDAHASPTESKPAAKPAQKSDDPAPRDTERKQRESNARADDDRRQANAKAKADTDRAEDNCRDTQSRSRADETRRQPQQAEAKARDEDNRRQAAESKSRDDDNRRQATAAKARDDDNRRQAAEAKSRDDDNRRQAAESQAKADRDRQEAENTRRASDDAARKSAAEQNDRKSDSSNSGGGGGRRK